MQLVYINVFINMGEDVSKAVMYIALFISMLLLTFGFSYLISHK